MNLTLEIVKASDEELEAACHTVYCTSSKLNPLHCASLEHGPVENDFVNTTEH